MFPGSRCGWSLAGVLLLAGCSTVDFDREIAAANESQRAFTQGHLLLARDEAQRTQRLQQAQALLARPLTQDDAVHLALVHSPALQVLLAQYAGQMAAADQAGRIPNPILSLERLRTGDELDLGRKLSVGLLDLIVLPQRRALAQQQQAQVRVQLAATVVEQVSAVRQDWVRAVAAGQVLTYARQVHQAAEASAQLAQKMQAVGNFSRLQRARQHAFYADATAQLARAQHAATAAREALVRRLGLDDAQADRLQLPERLPDLPAAPRPTSEVARSARETRLDWQLVRLQLEAAGQAQRLDLVQGLVDVELSARQDTRTDASSRSTTRGWEIDLRLPLFDWGDARRTSMNANSLAAAYRYDAVVRSVSSQLRESYSAYRTAWELARHAREEVVPLRKTMSEENLLRYNGMFIGVFELLADTREQIGSVIAAIDAQHQFWLADAALSAALIGQPTPTAGGLAPVRSASDNAAPGH